MKNSKEGNENKKSLEKYNNGKFPATKTIQIYRCLSLPLKKKLSKKHYNKQSTTTRPETKVIQFHHYSSLSSNRVPQKFEPTASHRSNSSTPAVLLSHNRKGQNYPPSPNSKNLRKPPLSFLSNSNENSKSHPVNSPIIHWWLIIVVTVIRLQRVT